MRFKMNDTSVRNLTKNIDIFSKSSINKAEMAMEGLMAYGEAEAKRNAPWSDITGNARNSINGGVIESNKNKIVGGLAIGMNYGVFLELKNNGKYRILWPTLTSLTTKFSSFFRGII